MIGQQSQRYFDAAVDLTVTRIRYQRKGFAGFQVGQRCLDTVVLVAGPRLKPSFKSLDVYSPLSFERVL